MELECGTRLNNGWGLLKHWAYCAQPQPGAGQAGDESGGQHRPLLGAAQHRQDKRNGQGKVNGDRSMAYEPMMVRCRDTMMQVEEVKVIDPLMLVHSASRSQIH